MREWQRQTGGFRGAPERPYSSNDLIVGSQVGHYRILQTLGSGGMGEVCFAEDTTLGRQVALKVLPDSLSKRGRHDLESEARTLAALDHPNIVRVFSVEYTDGVQFMTMQFVRGRTLAALLPPGGFPLDRFFSLAIPFVDAIAAAHQAGLIHRDLKPGNVMIGDDDHVTVLDFGIAKVTDTSADGQIARATVTATAGNHVTGTVAYMSPEQAEGKPIDTRSDMFALGIMLFEMLTGQRPFRGETTAAAIASVLRDEPVDLRTLSPRVPAELARLISRCLAKSLTKRLQSAIDLRNELEYLRDCRANGDAVPSSAAPRSRELPRGCSQPAVARR